MTEILVEEGADFPIGDVIAKVEEKAIPAAAPKVAPTPVESRISSAAEESVVEAPETPKVAPVVEAEPPKTVTPVGAETRVKMTPLRRTIARRLVEAQQTAAMLTTFNEADMTAIFDLRKKYQERFVEKHGTKLGFMSFFVKAIVDSLQVFPAVNAEIDGDYIVYKNFYNIGVAVSGPKGLMVPVVRNADQLSFAEVELEIKRLAGFGSQQQTQTTALSRWNLHRFQWWCLWFSSLYSHFESPTGWYLGNAQHSTASCECERKCRDPSNDVLGFIL